MKATKQHLDLLSEGQKRIIEKGIVQVNKTSSHLGNSISHFEIVSELGKGSFGTVYLVRQKGQSFQPKVGLAQTQNFNSRGELKSGVLHFNSTKQSTADLFQMQAFSSLSDQSQQMFVLKKIPMGKSKFKQQLAAIQEAQIMQELEDLHGGHPHLVRYFTSFYEEETLYIVMEYAGKGDLYSLIKDQRNRQKYISERDMWDYSYQICSAVKFMHQHGFMHRDIKCLNIFLTDNKTLKIGDLGVSKYQRRGMLIKGSRVGTPLYLAPEVVRAQPYDHKVDIWAIGCALYHLACLEPPFQSDNLLTLGNIIANRRPKALPRAYSQKFRTFIDSLLEKNPQDRPTAIEAMAMIPSFIKNEREKQMVQHVFDQPQMFEPEAEIIRSSRGGGSVTKNVVESPNNVVRLKPSQINYSQLPTETRFQSKKMNQSRSFKGLSSPRNDRPPTTESQAFLKQEQLKKQQRLSADRLAADVKQRSNVVRCRNQRGIDFEVSQIEEPRKTENQQADYVQAPARERLCSSKMKLLTTETSNKDLSVDLKPNLVMPLGAVDDVQAQLVFSSFPKSQGPGQSRNREDTAFPTKGYSLGKRKTEEIVKNRDQSDHQQQQLNSLNYSQGSFEKLVKPLLRLDPSNSPNRASPSKSAGESPNAAALKTKQTAWVRPKIDSSNTSPNAQINLKSILSPAQSSYQSMKPSTIKPHHRPGAAHKNGKARPGAPAHHPTQAPQGAPMRAIHFNQPRIIEEKSPTNSDYLQLQHLKDEQRRRMEEGRNAMMIKNEFGANMSDASVNVQSIDRQFRSSYYSYSSLKIISKKSQPTKSFLNQYEQKKLRPSSSAAHRIIGGKALVEPQNVQSRTIDGRGVSSAFKKHCQRHVSFHDASDSESCPIKEDLGEGQFALDKSQDEGCSPKAAAFNPRTFGFQKPQIKSTVSRPMSSKPKLIKGSVIGKLTRKADLQAQAAGKGSAVVASRGGTGSLMVRDRSRIKGFAALDSPLTQTKEEEPPIPKSYLRGEADGTMKKPGGGTVTFATSRASLIKPSTGQFSQPATQVLKPQQPQQLVTPPQRIKHISPLSGRNEPSRFSSSRNQIRPMAGIRQSRTTVQSSHRHERPSTTTKETEPVSRNLINLPGPVTSLDYSLVEARNPTQAEGFVNKFVKSLKLRHRPNNNVIEEPVISRGARVLHSSCQQARKKITVRDLHRR